MRGINAVRHELRTTSGDAFHQLFTSLLAGVMDHVAPTKRMGQLDAQGIDSFQYDPDDDAIVLAVQ
jgi:hypothetical protein